MKVALPFYEVTLCNSNVILPDLQGRNFNCCCYFLPEYHYFLCSTFSNPLSLLYILCKLFLSLLCQTIEIVSQSFPAQSFRLQSFLHSCQNAAFLEGHPRLQRDSLSPPYYTYTFLCSTQVLL